MKLSRGALLLLLSVAVLIIILILKSRIPSGAFRILLLIASAFLAYVYYRPGQGPK